MKTVGKVLALFLLTWVVVYVFYWMQILLLIITFVRMIPGMSASWIGWLACVLVVIWIMRLINNKFVKLTWLTFLISQALFLITMIGVLQIVFSRLSFIF